MDIPQNILDSIGSIGLLILTSGVLQVILNWVIHRRTSTMDELREILDRWQTDNDQLRDRVTESEDKKESLTDSLSSLRRQLLEIETAHTKEVAAYRMEIEALRSENTELRDTVDRLERRIKELERSVNGGA